MAAPFSWRRAGPLPGMPIHHRGEVGPGDPLPLLAVARPQKKAPRPTTSSPIFSPSLRSTRVSVVVALVRSTLRSEARTAWRRSGGGGRLRAGARLAAARVVAARLVTARLVTA